MNTMKSIIAVLFFVSIVSLCAMEKQKDNVISDADLLVRKKAFALEFKSREKKEFEYLLYPKESNIKIDVKKLNEELELGNAVYDFGNCGDNMWILVPVGMDEKFIHKTLVPQCRIPDSESLELIW